MKNVTNLMVEEHKLIIRMIALLEKNTARLENGQETDPHFFLEAVDFIRSYADRFHHAKEEDVLFRELVKNGMPADNSPVGAMLQTHTEGRVFVAELENAAIKLLGDDRSAIPVIIKAARNYAALLRNHIHVEDNVLYPLSERLLPETVRQLMTDDYTKAEQSAGPGFEAKYLEMVEKWEKR